MDIVSQKKALRKAARTMRAKAAAAAPRAGETLASMVMARGIALPHMVSAYIPMREEMDPMPLAHALRSKGSAIALPALVDGLMEFRAYEPGDVLQPGPFGTVEPVGHAVKPDLLLVPLLAFTRNGERLGYGGGHYDRYLADHSDATTVGIAFAAQELQALPLEAHDRRLQAVWTEREMIAVGERLCV
ncbi:MAG: 5-formyltetrahydrofolate cyclo-ligase [Pseudomonadota bacterium]